VAELRDYQRATINEFECLVAPSARSVLDFDVALRRCLDE
jgi:hypothetical protein